MPVCPNCKQEFPRRKDGGCPGCGTELQSYSGRWFREDIGSPTVAIIEHFEKRVSIAQTAERHIPVKYRISRKGDRFRRELVVAERLLDAADDIEQVFKAIDLLFDDKQFNFKTRTSLLGIERDFGLSLSIVEAIEESEKERSKKQDEIVNKVLNRENIFS